MVFYDTKRHVIFDGRRDSTIRPKIYIVMKYREKLCIVFFFYRVWTTFASVRFLVSSA